MSRDPLTERFENCDHKGALTLGAGVSHCPKCKTTINGSHADLKNARADPKALYDPI